LLLESPFVGLLRAPRGGMYDSLGADAGAPLGADITRSLVANGGPESAWTINYGGGATSDGVLWKGIDGSTRSSLDGVGEAVRSMTSVRSSSSNGYW
jgi:hypothetical protein